MAEQHPDMTALIEAALAEDIGSGDITSQLIIPEDKQGEIRFVARQELIACGTFIPAAVYAQIDTMVKSVAKVAEGARLMPNTVMAIARGPARALLAGERVALNLMQRMSGVSTLTAKYVEAIAGTKAVLLDTRKTMPGMRSLDKYAVRVAGGKNHRMRLDDMVLIKDNHIAICGGVALAVERARAGLLKIVMPVKTGIHIPEAVVMDSRLRGNDGNKGGNDGKIKIVVECDTLDQVAEALQAKPDRILLDNMSNDMLREAVRMSGGNIPLEASGGVSLKTIRAIAGTGVDFISVGKITHSADAVDIGADTEMKN